MNEKKSALLKKLTKQLAIGVPVVALSGVLPGVGGVLVGSASAEGYPESSSSYKAKAEAKYKKAKPEAEAEGKKAVAEAEAEAEAEGEAKSEAEAY